MLGHRGTDVPVGLSLPRHAVHLPLTDLLRPLGLAAHDLVLHTVVAAVALAARAALGTHLGLVARVVDVHGILGAGARA